MFLPVVPGLDFDGAHGTAVEAPAPLQARQLGLAHHALEFQVVGHGHMAPAARHAFASAPGRWSSRITPSDRKSSGATTCQPSSRVGHVAGQRGPRNILVRLGLFGLGDSGFPAATRFEPEFDRADPRRARAGRSPRRGRGASCTCTPRVGDHLAVDLDGARGNQAPRRYERDADSGGQPEVFCSLHDGTPFPFAPLRPEQLARRRLRTVGRLSGGRDRRLGSGSDASSAAGSLTAPRSWDATLLALSSSSSSGSSPQPPRGSCEPRHEVQVDDDGAAPARRLRRPRLPQALRPHPRALNRARHHARLLLGRQFGGIRAGVGRSLSSPRLNTRRNSGVVP